MESSTTTKYYGLDEPIFPNDLSIELCREAVKVRFDLQEIYYGITTPNSL
jgi:hypothetical protein